MNGIEQQERRTAILDLKRRLDRMDSDIVDLMNQEVKDRRADVAQLMNTIRVEVGEERTHRLELAMQQRDYVDSHDREHAHVLLSFIMMSWWMRWVWCVLGGSGMHRLERLIHIVQAHYRDWAGRP